MVSPKISKISAKQAEILEQIESVIAQTGRPPTYRDLAAALGTAIGTVQDHVSALIKKGFLKREEGVSRGLMLAHQRGSLSIPILGTVPAGRPIEAIGESLGTLNVAAHTLSTKQLHEVYALRVTGESMIEAGILDGDFVIVRKNAEVRNGDVVVAMINGEATVKTYERKDGRVRLLPANAKFSPIEISSESDNRVEGKVIGLQRVY